MPDAAAADAGADRVPAEDTTQVARQALPMDAAPVPATGEPERTQPDKVPVESPGLLSDCRLMLSYARKNGLEIPAELLHEIAWLDGVLATLNISPISAISTSLLTALTKEEISKGFRPRATVPGSSAPVPAPAPVPARPEPEVPRVPGAQDIPQVDKNPPARQAPAAADVAPPAADGLSPEEMVLKVHAGLSTLIAPTTALSLQTSEPPPGKAHIFGGMPPLVENTIWVALVSALLFIVSAAFIGHEAGVAKDAKTIAAEAAAATASAAAAASAAEASGSASALKAKQAAPATSAAIPPRSEPGASK